MKEKEKEKDITAVSEYDESSLLQTKIADLARVLEKMRLEEYIEYFNRPGHLLLLNFGVGLMRGLGAAIGATILAGLALIFLKNLVVLNLPVIGGLIAELVRIVNTYLNTQ